MINTRVETKRLDYGYRKAKSFTQGSVGGIDKPISVAVEEAVLQEDGPFRTLLT